MIVTRAARIAQLASARSKRWQAPAPLHFVQEAAHFAFALIANGGRFTQLQQIFAFCNIVTPSESDSYRAQELICAEIAEMARNSCCVWRDRMNPETIIAMSGSWSQRRNAMHCVVDFVDTCANKVPVLKSLKNKSGLFMAIISALQTEWRLKVFDV
jgi:hypothetical protein